MKKDEKTIILAAAVLIFLASATAGFLILSPSHQPIVVIVPSIICPLIFVVFLLRRLHLMRHHQ